MATAAPAGSTAGMEHWIVFLLVGAVAGWLAGQLMKGRGFGLLGNIIVGILGGIVGGWLCGQLGLHLGEGIVGAIFTALLGAVVLLLLASFVRRAE